MVTRALSWGRTCLRGAPRRSFCTEPFEPSVKKGLVLGCYYDGKEMRFTKAAQKYNDHIGGRLYDMVCDSGRTLRRGQIALFNNIGPDYWSIVVVGLGPRNCGFNHAEYICEDLEAVRIATAVGAKTLQENGCHCLCVDGCGYPEQAAEGSCLAVWTYQENRKKENQINVPQLELFEDPDQESWQRGLFKAESQNFVRTLSDTPSNLMTPFHMAQVVNYLSSASTPPNRVL